MRGGCRILFQYSMSFRPFQVRAAGRSPRRCPVQHGPGVPGPAGCGRSSRDRVVRPGPCSFRSSPGARPAQASGCDPGRSGCIPPGRNLRVHPAADQPAGLHGPQLVGKHLLRYMADGLPLDQRLPLVPDEHERGFHRAGGQILHRRAMVCMSAMAIPSNGFLSVTTAQKGACLTNGRCGTMIIHGKGNDNPSRIKCPV